ncbi:hypothetical protein [Streptomyces sviceus]|uniref:hypothetical protein n=1 Tax=Streptomyces sviceus TaxID=285530 RepID=UPI0033319BB4
MADIRKDVDALKAALDPGNPTSIAATVATLKSALDPKASQSLASTVAGLKSALDPAAAGSFAHSANAQLSTLQQEVAALKNKPANKFLDPQLQKGDSQALATHAQLFKLDFSVMKADEKGLTIGGVQVMTWPWAREGSKLSTSLLSEKERGRRSPEAREKKQRAAEESAAALKRAEKERAEAQKVRTALTKLVDELKTTRSRGNSFKQTMREIAKELNS